MLYHKGKRDADDMHLAAIMTTHKMFTARLTLKLFGMRHYPHQLGTIADGLNALLYNASQI